MAFGAMQGSSALLVVALKPSVFRGSSGVWPPLFL